MKKQIVTIGAAMLFVVGSVTFIGCGNSEDGEHTENHEHAEGEEHEEVAETAYYCPMKCEGEKTYADENTPCPTCGMDLVVVE